MGQNNTKQSFGNASSLSWKWRGKERTRGQSMPDDDGSGGRWRVQKPGLSWLLWPPLYLTLGLPFESVSKSNKKKSVTITLTVFDGNSTQYSFWKYGGIRKNLSKEATNKPIKGSYQQTYQGKLPTNLSREATNKHIKGSYQQTYQGKLQKSSWEATNFIKWSYQTISTETAYPT